MFIAPLCLDFALEPLCLKKIDIDNDFHVLIDKPHCTYEFCIIVCCFQVRPPGILTVVQVALQWLQLIANIAFI